jgi:CPA2 family monovalent cation:H+ antiporter-2
MQLNFAVLPQLWPWIVLLVLGLIIGKGCLIALLTWFYGKDREVALRTGSVLAHGGEFGFALLALALSTGLLTLDNSQPILAAIVVTMLIAPLLIRHNRTLARRLLPKRTARTSADAAEIAAALKGVDRHVVICGFGRVGGQLAALLRTENIPYVALDLQPDRVKQAWKDGAWEPGQQVFYGDAGHRDILQAVGLVRARALVISFSHDAAALNILHNARSLCGDLPILVRSRDDAHLETLLAAGATEVIPETLEASLMLTTQLMLLLGMPDARIDDLVQAVRGDRYMLLRKTMNDLP